ncbi:MAG: cobalamin B12-binding domain-containing protein [Pseudomonadota bacterium]
MAERYRSPYTIMSDPIEGLARAALERVAAVRAVGGPWLVQSDAETQLSIFCERLVDGDLIAAEATVRELSSRYESFEALAEELIAEASRRLGRMWDHDEISFTEVSIGVSTLFHLATRMSVHSALASFGAQGNALFVTLDGQAHTLGIVLAAEAFRQHGWSVELRLGEDIDRALHVVATKKVLIVGLTCSQADQRNDVARFVAEARSIQPGANILLGGTLVSAEPERAEALGADRLVSSLAGALNEAERVRTAQPILPHGPN